MSNSKKVSGNKEPPLKDGDDGQDSELQNRIKATVQAKILIIIGW